MALLMKLSTLAPAAQEATAYYVGDHGVMVRSQPREFVLGRLYGNRRVDIQYVRSSRTAKFGLR